MLDKKAMSEEDIKRVYITPALYEAGWQEHIVMEYYFTDGRIMVADDKATRAAGKKADYVLFHQKNLPLAIVEAKDNQHSVAAGLQQAIEYGDILDIPYVYSSNGDGFIEHDRLTGKEREIGLSEFPTREDLWKRYIKAKNLTLDEVQLIEEPYYFKQGDKTPRYYQRIAINRTIEAIAKGQNRILLVMATGTGKTYTAFQIIHRLWKAGRKKKVLFLADRNILVDQTMMQDFKPFSKIMTKIEGRKLDSSYEVYLSLYHQLAGEEGSEPFREFKPNFFDLIVVDECHRGSAKEDSQWRRILEYFNTATHIGLTATPKETKEVSNITYFGEPVYTYSLKEGIADGFLAPYKVIRVNLDVDIEGFRPETNQVDDQGLLIEDRDYGVLDYDKRLVLEKRTVAVAKHISDYLKEHDRFAKTIVFCVDIDHAERMRQALVNENSDQVAIDSRYVMKITGDDKVGKAQLDNFIDVHSKYPVIVTTSKLLSTGVDCKTCKLIVLDNNIESMTEFKQIIGRGTRINADHNKYFFTIMDFKGATRKFFDPDFDGDPIVIFNPEGGDGTGGGRNPGGGSEKEYEKYRLGGLPAKVIHEQEMLLDTDGKLIVGKYKDFTRTNILGEYATLEIFKDHWKKEHYKTEILEELKRRGIDLEVLRDHMKLGNIDEFDLICYVAYNQKPLTRSERVKRAKESGLLDHYGAEAREILDALLDKYMENGIRDLENIGVLGTDPFRTKGSPLKLTQYFGGKDGYLAAIQEITNELYM